MVLLSCQMKQTLSKISITDKGDFTMTAQMLTQVHEDRNDNRTYFVQRDGRIVQRHWRHMSDAERALQLEAEARAAYVAAFNISSERRRAGSISARTVMIMTEQQVQPQPLEWLTPHQIDALSQPLDMRLIRHRKGGGGKMLAYLTGKTVIDTANRIFGFGGWGVKVLARSRETCADGKKGQMEFYTCDIELYVAGSAFPFPGDGVGIVNDPYTIEMHEKARKDAYTDALKRALRHFGDQFALCLYDPDDYVQAPDGTQVQVKEVPINDGKHQPRQIVDAGKQQAIASAQHPPLDEQIKQDQLMPLL
jgi:DNA recombination protein Rad52